ncbi:MAG: hypothetical protein VX320_01635 [Candidatus Thermoplasmatota archaeon]|nr:hypothetical protein [Candidatus Thermoplasmatota archaeon]
MADSDALEPLRIDSKSWSHRDLLERIISRHFHIVEEASGVDIGWQVRLNGDGNDSSVSLENLNRHLRKLSWLAILQEGEPYDLVIIPNPPSGGELEGGQLLAVWGVFTLFLTLTGSAWLQLQSGESLLAKSLLIESFVWFAFPIVLTLFLASETRRRIGLSNGVDLGHHMPLAMPFLMTPSNPVWPFGLLAFLSQRRMELVPFNDRRSLTIISATGPILMIVLGSFFTIIGFLRTSLDAVPMESAPIMVEPPVFVDFILSMMMPAEEYELRSVWLHPLGLAGIALTTFGWILLLPLPGFPGDRVLTGLIGPDEMESGGTQTQLFVGILIAGMVIIYFGSFWPWLLLIGLGAWRRFSPESSSAPFVLDEVKSFDESTRTQMSLGLVCILLLSFPGLVPVDELSDWDEGLDTSEWPTEISYSPNEKVAIELPLQTVGVIPIDLDFQFSLSGIAPMVWSVCANGDTSSIGLQESICSFEQIGAISESNLTISFVAPALGQLSAPFELGVHWLDQESNTMSHIIRFESNTLPSPANISWSWNGDFIMPEYCIDILLDEEMKGNLSLESPLFSFSGDSRLALESGQGRQTVCVEGVYGSGRTLTSGQLALSVTLDDGTILNWPIGIEGQYSHHPSGAWPADEFFSGTFYMILLDEDESEFCPLELGPREKWSLFGRVGWNQDGVNGTWKWNLSEIQMGLHSTDDNFAEKGTIEIPGGGKLLRCFGSQFHDVHFLVQAPQPISSFGGQDMTRTSGTENISITNHGNESVLIDVNPISFGVQPYENLTSLSLQPGATWEIFIPQYAENETLQNIAWLEPDSDRWVLHIVTHCISADGCAGGES